MNEEELAQCFSDAMYRYINGAKIAVNAIFGASGLGAKGFAISMRSAYINEKERSKATFARDHKGWSDDKKRNFNEAWASRSSIGPAGPRLLGSPRVFKGY